MSAGQKHQSMVGQLVCMKEKAEEALSYERHVCKELRERFEALQKKTFAVEEKQKRDLDQKETFHSTRHSQAQQELARSKEAVRTLES